MDDSASPGPFGSEREARESVSHILSSRTEAWRDGNHKLMEDACTAAAVELGAYDHLILQWLAGREPATCAVIAGLILRAHENAPADGPGVVMPGGGWISGPST